VRGPFTPQRAKFIGCAKRSAAHHLPALPSWPFLTQRRKDARTQRLFCCLERPADPPAALRLRDKWFPPTHSEDPTPLPLGDRRGFARDPLTEALRSPGVQPVDAPGGGEYVFLQTNGRRHGANEHGQGTAVRFPKK